MELTRENFIKVIQDEEIFFATNTPFFTKKGNELLKIISKHFFDDKLVTSLQVSPINEIAFPNSHPSILKDEKFKDKWIENVYQIDVIKIFEYYLVKYFEKTGEHHFITLLKFFRACFEIKDDWSEHFKKFYNWFCARYSTYSSAMIRDLNQEILLQQKDNVISMNSDRCIAFDPAPIVEYFEKETEYYVKCNVKKVFGIYYDSYFRYYIMYEDGTIRDNISRKRQQFDPVTVMLTKLYEKPKTI